MKTKLLLACLSSLLSACGGGGDSSENTPTSSVVTTDVQKAVMSGNASLVKDSNQFIEEIERLNSRHVAASNAIKKAINGGAQSLYWDPTHDAALFSPTYGFNDSILNTNRAVESGYSDQSLSLGIAGEYGTNGRYVLLGSNPFRTSLRFPNSVNDQMNDWLSNMVTWLTGKNADESKQIAIAQMDQSYYFPDEKATRQWLDEKFPERVSYNLANTCDGSAMNRCIDAQPDLLIVSQHLRDSDTLDEVTAAIQRAEQLEIPILYLQWDGTMTQLGDWILSRFHVDYVGDNYWRKLAVEGWNPNQILDFTPEEISTQLAFLNKFRYRNFNVDLSNCDNRSCPEDANMDSEFYSPVNSISRRVTELDKQKIDLFKQADYEYEKLMILLADHYRQSVTFPMDKNATDINAFLRSYFADYIQYNSRHSNPVQPDMGNFSRSEFGEEIRRVDKLVTMESKKNFRSAGVYALPGETFTVTRKDTNSVTTKIVVNSLRSGATHEFYEYGYNRPKFVTSSAYEVDPGETITLTSAYGGPIHVHFDQNDAEVQLQFGHIAQHPVWKNEADNQLFTEQLEANQFDWAELITPGFEVHSKRDKMIESVSSWDSPAAMAEATERYMHNFPHALAGFKGPGIDVIRDIQSLATEKGWEVENIDIVKHMNADQATCGYGCSGNPYDAYWSFNPIGHGDLHELGHGLEKSRFRFSGWVGHSTTNYYSYYSKSRYYQDTGIDPSCQSLDFKQQFDLLQQSREQANPSAYMAEKSETGWSWGARIYIQMMMQAQHQGVVDSGWHLLGRLHLIEREFKRLKVSEELWLERRGSVGFSGYSLAEANSISNNDWLLIALSVVTNFDMRDYLSMWGFSFSDKAQNEVLSMNLEAMPLLYFASSNRGYCKAEFAQLPVPIDGTTPWPL